jgi:CheY-like chemotaxis protein
MAKTLLLADDSVTIQKVVNISFASENVTLVTVDNGDDAIERARETRPDLILADVVMPGKSGYEVCEAIKADPDLRHIPVLLLSGTFEAFDEERAARAGAAGHVAKPFEAQTLVDQVNRLLASAPSPAATAPAPLVPPEAVTEMTNTQDADSFDFFDDDLGELDAAAAMRSDGAVAFDDEESAFAFGDEDLTPPESIPQLETPASRLGPALPLGPATRASVSEPFPDRTVAILPNEAGEPLASVPGPAEVPPTALVEDPIGCDLRDPNEELLSASAYELEDSFLTGDASATSDEAFDFSFERESTAPESIPAETVRDAAFVDSARDSSDESASEPAVEPDPAADDLLQGTVLDPGGLAGFGVPGPELADSLAPDPILATPPTSDSTHSMDADSLLHESIAVAEVDDADDSDDSAEPAELLSAKEPMVLDGPIDPMRPSPSAAETARPLPDDSAARAEAVLAAMTPSLQAAVHDTLEKIAWESFGEVTEKIVREVVDRVEKIAWEVIPQLTETLVKAEIRRMKGEDRN